MATRVRTAGNQNREQPSASLEPSTINDTDVTWNDSYWLLAYTYRLGTAVYSKFNKFQLQVSYVAID